MEDEETLSMEVDESDGAESGGDNYTENEIYELNCTYSRNKSVVMCAHVLLFHVSNTRE